MPHTRSVSVVFFLGAGGCFEPEAESGISHFIEHLCFKGTGKRRTAKEISEAIEGVGGVINGGTDKELTVFWCKVASQHFELALDILIDLLRNSRFDNDDINRERQVIIEEINMSLDSPRQRVDMLIDELLWQGQPLGRDVAGSKESVSLLTQEQIVNFFSQHYLANNAIVSISGDIEHERAQDIVGRSLRDWRQGDIAPRYQSRITQGKPRISVEFRETEQVNLCLGLPGLSLFDTDRFAVDLLSIVLGEGMSSRLFIDLREKQGLAYEIHSCADHFVDSGAVIVRAGIDPQRIQHALEAIIDHLFRLGDGISEVELSRAKEMAKGRLLLALENSRNVANWLGAQEMLMGRILTVDEVTSLIDAVSVDDLIRVARQLIVANRFNLAIVGPVQHTESINRLLKL